MFYRWVRALDGALGLGGSSRPAHRRFRAIAGLSGFAPAATAAAIFAVGVPVVAVAGEGGHGWWPFGKRDSGAQSVTNEDSGASSPTTGRPKVTRRILIKGESDARDFVALAKRDREIKEELPVLRRLLDEKRREGAVLKRGLESRFSIASSGAYQYDREHRTIFELSAAPAGEAGTIATNGVGEASSSTQLVRRVHMRLDEEQARNFLKLVMAKKLVDGDADTLARLMDLKTRAFNELRATLKTRFLIRDDRDYRYDPKTRIVTELERAPREGESAARLTSDDTHSK